MVKGIPGDLRVGLFAQTTHAANVLRANQPQIPPARRTTLGHSTRGQILAFSLFGAILVLAAVTVVPALIVSNSHVPDAAERLELQNSVRTTFVPSLGAS